MNKEDLSGTHIFATMLTPGPKLDLDKSTKCSFKSKT